MKRYLRLYLNFLRFSLSKAMEFRVDFFFRIGMDTVYYIVHILFFKVLFFNTNLLAGWTFEQAIIFMSGFIMIDALFMTFFANNVWWLPIFVNRGDLDYYLTRPVSSLFFLTTREIAANSFVNLLMTVGIMIWAFSKYPGEVEGMRVLFFVLLLLNGTFLNLLIFLLFVLPVFWTHSRGLTSLHYIGTELSEYPDKIFFGPVRKLFTFVLPYFLMSSIPARFLFEDIGWEAVLGVFAMTFVYFVLIRAFWNRALKSYSSASS